jgi:hypothetical protein
MEYFAAIHVPENAVRALFLFMILAGCWTGDCLVSGASRTIGEWVRRRLQIHALRRACRACGSAHGQTHFRPEGGHESTRPPVCAERMLATE